MKATYILAYNNVHDIVDLLDNILVSLVIPGRQKNAFIIYPLLKRIVNLKSSRSTPHYYSERHALTNSI